MKISLCVGHTSCIISRRNYVHSYLQSPCKITNKMMTHNDDDSDRETRIHTYVTVDMSRSGSNYTHTFTDRVKSTLRFLRHYLSESDHDLLSTSAQYCWKLVQLHVIKARLLVDINKKVCHSNLLLKDAGNNGRVVEALLLINQGADVNQECCDRFSLTRFLVGVSTQRNVEDAFNEEMPEEIRHCIVERSDGKFVVDVTKAIEFVVLLPSFYLTTTKDVGSELHLFAEMSYDLNVNIGQLCHLLTQNRSYEECNYVNKKGFSAFMYSVIHCKPQRLCLAAIPGIDVNLPLRQSCTVMKVNEARRSRICAWSGGKLEVPAQFTPLMIACLYHDELLFEKLLARDDLKLATEYIDAKKGIAVSTSICRKAVYPGDTHIHHAVMNADIDFLKFVLKTVGPAALKSVNTLNENVLHKACNFQQREIILLLLSKEELRKIFQTLTDEDYIEFVNQSSNDATTGKAASCFRFFANEDNERSVFQAFVKCKDYDLTALDREGNSLLHIISEKSYADLMQLAANRAADGDFAKKNGAGATPLMIVIQSDAEESVDVIKQMAVLAHTRKDINPNQNFDIYTKLRDKMIDLQGMFGVFNGVQWDVDKMLNVYLGSESKVSFDVSCHEDYFEAKVINADGVSNCINLQKELSYCLTEIYNSKFGECSRLPVKRPAIEGSLHYMYEMLLRKFTGLHRGSLHWKYNGEEINVVYKIREYGVCKTYQAMVTYEWLIGKMGKEWDYRDNSDVSGKLLKKETQLLTHVPPLYLLLLQIKEIREKERCVKEKENVQAKQETKAEQAVQAGQEVKSLPLRKLDAFLSFREIKIQTANDVTQGLINMLKYASEYCGQEVTDRLNEKLKSQPSGTETEEGFAAEVNYEIDYNDLRRHDHQPFKELSECAGLQIFAKLFCERINSVTAYRKHAQVDQLSRLMDAMARVLEVDSVCAAICFVGDKFVLSSNFGVHSNDENMKEKVRGHVKEAARKLFLYAADCATKSRQIDHFERSFEILKPVLAHSMGLSIIPGEIKKIYTRDKKFKKFLQLLKMEHNLRDVIEYCYANCNKIFMVVTKDETGESIFTRAFEFVKNNCLMRQLSLNEKQFYSTQIRNSVYTICRLVRDILKIREGAQRQIFTGAMLQAFAHENYTVHPNYGMLHAETDLIINIVTSDVDIAGGQIYVGLSKVCCVHCTLFIQCFNNKCFSNEDIYVATRGSHVSHYSWTIPKYLTDNIDKLAVFLGGKRSTLYHSFVNLDQHKKIAALKLVEDISVKSLDEENKKNSSNNENTNSVFKELLDILGQKGVSHSRPELSATELASIPDICSFEDRSDDEDEVRDYEVEDKWCIAIQKLDTKEIKGLLESSNYKINVNLPEPIETQTALHVAVIEQDVKLIENLISCGANIHIKNKTKESPDDLIQLTRNQSLIDLFYPKLAAERRILIESIESAQLSCIQARRFTGDKKIVDDIAKELYDNKNSLLLSLSRSTVHQCIGNALEHIMLSLIAARNPDHYKSQNDIACSMLTAISFCGWHLHFHSELPLVGAFWRNLSLIYVAESSHQPRCTLCAVSCEAFAALVFYYLQPSLADDTGNELVVWRDNLADNPSSCTAPPRLAAVTSAIAHYWRLMYIREAVEDYIENKLTSPKWRKQRWLSCLMRIGEALDESSRLRNNFSSREVLESIVFRRRIQNGEMAKTVLLYLAESSDAEGLDDLAVYWEKQFPSINELLKKFEDNMSKPPTESLIQITQDSCDDVTNESSSYAQALSSLKDDVVCNLRHYIAFARKVKLAYDESRQRDNRKVVQGYQFLNYARHLDDDVMEFYHMIIAALANKLLASEQFVEAIKTSTVNDLKAIKMNARTIFPKRLQIYQNGEFSSAIKQHTLFYKNSEQIISTVSQMRIAQFAIECDTSLDKAEEALAWDRQIIAVTLCEELCQVYEAVQRRWNHKCLPTGVQKFPLPRYRALLEAIQVEGEEGFAGNNAWLIHHFEKLAEDAFNSP